MVVLAVGFARAVAPGGETQSTPQLAWTEHENPLQRLGGACKPLATNSNCRNDLSPGFFARQTSRTASDKGTC